MPIASMSRRGLLALGGTAGVGAGAGALATHAADKPAKTGTAPVSDRVEFFGTHQAGIATPAQQRLAFAAYDVTVKGSLADNRQALRQLLQTWTAAAAAMCDGQPVPGDSTAPEA